jgi:hypothetical protein
VDISRNICVTNPTYINVEISSKTSKNRK